MNCTEDTLTIDKPDCKGVEEALCYKLAKRASSNRFDGQITHQQAQQHRHRCYRCNNNVVFCN